MAHGLNGRARTGFGEKNIRHLRLQTGLLMGISPY
jgi:hypothetical protein